MKKKKKKSFPIILKQVVGSDSQYLSPPRQSSQNLREHYDIVPLKVKFYWFSKYLLLANSRIDRHF